MRGKKLRPGDVTATLAKEKNPAIRVLDYERERAGQIGYTSAAAESGIVVTPKPLARSKLFTAAA